MIHPTVYPEAFAELKAQKYTIRRRILDARIEKSKNEVSEWEKEASQKLLSMFSAGETKYRHLVFDSAENVYAWNGCGFIPVDVDAKGLFFHDDWSEYTYPPLEEIRSASDLLCWHLETFAQRMPPTKRLRSLWVIGTNAASADEQQRPFPSRTAGEVESTNGFRAMELAGAEEVIETLVADALSAASRVPSSQSLESPKGGAR